MIVCRSNTGLTKEARRIVEISESAGYEVY